MQQFTLLPSQPAAKPCKLGMRHIAADQGLVWQFLDCRALRQIKSSGKLAESFDLMEQQSMSPKPPKSCLVCAVAMQTTMTEKSIVHHCRRCDLVITIAPL